MIILPKSNDTDLRQLLYDVQEGKIQLPEFQRDWTWDDNRIRGIIASLSQGYPMGAIMQLQYGNPDIKFKYRTITGVENKNVTPEYLVLDGQQRLTSIYQSTYSNQVVATKTDKGKSIKRFYYLDMNKCLDDDEDRLDAVVSVPEDRKIKANFDRDIIMDLSTRELEYQLKMFPINIIYDNTQLMQWNFGYMMYHQNDKDANDLLNRFQKEVVETILQYKLPVITLDKSTPREAVCKVFENVNTGGVPLTVFELVTATYATNEFDLRKDWEKCKKIIRAENETLRTDLLDGIDEINFLTSVTLYTSYKNKVNGKSGTISCKKFRQRDLPYTTQLIPLSATCAYLGKKTCNEPNTKKILERWYWCGILGEMYGGANETRYANDIEDIIDEVYKRPSQMRTVNSSFFSATRLLTLQTRLSAAYKGIMALLYKADCRDFMDNSKMNLVNSVILSPDIHHIFPEAYCQKVGIKRQKYNSIVNKTPILPPTNRSIGGDSPSKYIQTILNKVDGLTENELKDRIESHMINFEYLKQDDFDNYFIDRAKKLLNLIENAMGKNVSDRGSDDTIEQFGKSLI